MLAACLALPSGEQFAQSLPRTEQAHLAENNSENATHFGNAAPSVQRAHDSFPLPMRGLIRQGFATKSAKKMHKNC
jgi:hypothetical protein